MNFHSERPNENFKKEANTCVEWVVVYVVSAAKTYTMQSQAKPHTLNVNYVQHVASNTLSTEI